MINLHEGQSEVFEDVFIHRQHRFFPISCSRGWGKSYMAGTIATTAVFELMELSYKVPNKTVYIIAPTYGQVTDIYYPMLNYDMGLERYAISSSRPHGIFYLPNNVELKLLSYEAIERMRGKGAYLVVWDEPSSCTKGISPKEAWQGIIQPTIITRWSEKRAKLYGARSAGRAVIIGTPKGYNFFHELSTYEERDPMWKSYHYDYTQSPFLDQNEIERIKHTIDPIEFASEYLASFKDSGNSVFYCFDRNIHVRKDLEDFKDGEVVHVNIDFNVGIQASSFFAIRGKQIQILNEFKGHPDTDALAKAIKEKYPDHKIVAYPDPSGRSKKTSATGKTDFTILESYGIECRAHKAAPSIVDSVAAVNKKLMTAAGDVEFYVSNKCVGTIESLEKTKWVDKNPDTATIDKSESIEHFSDGIRYGTEYLFPVLHSTKRTKKGKNF